MFEVGAIHNNVNMFNIFLSIQYGVTFKANGFCFPILKEAI